MKIPISALLLALAAAFSGTAQTTPLEQIRDTPVSQIEFGSFKLEVALTGIKDWPFPIEGASVSYRLNPDQLEIVVALRIARAELFRTACAQTLGRVRKFLYIEANGVAPMGRSYLGAYFRGPWRGAERETALRGLDANARIRVDVVERGSCQAALIKAPVTFEAASPK